MKKIIALLLCVTFILSLAGCTQKSDDVTVGQLNADKIENVSINMNGDVFDDKFLTFIANSTEDNYMVSPLSFRYALGLLLAGAEGETKTELLSALGVKDEAEWTAYCTKFNGFVKRFYQQLDDEIKEFNTYKADFGLGAKAPFRALRVANSIWKREDIEKDFTSEYKEKIAANYGAEYCSFTPHNAVKKIHDWASRKTEKMIPKLLPDDYDTTHLAVVLMNALYFKDSWSEPFEKSATISDDFNTRSGKKVKKDFMRKTERLSYYGDENTQIVILPMDGGVSMAFVLGDRENLGEKISKCEQRTVKLKIPKMDMETSFENKELMAFLAQNGVSRAFDPNSADFSAMIDHNIWVDDIIQKTKIKTDEEGVEAAAVTAIMMKDEAMVIDPNEPVEFNADRPFSFYIYTTCDDVTAILFAGEVVE